MNEVDENLLKFIETVFPQRIESALEKASLIVVRAAKEKCPVDDGQLRQSITHEVVKEKDGLVAYVGTNVEYAPYIEKGTGIYNADGRKTPWSYQDVKGDWHTTKGMKEQPFLQPALDENRAEISKCFYQIF